MTGGLFRSALKGPFVFVDYFSLWTRGAEAPMCFFYPPPSAIYFLMMLLLLAYEQNQKHISRPS